MCENRLEQIRDKMEALKMEAFRLRVQEIRAATALINPVRVPQEIRIAIAKLDALASNVHCSGNFTPALSALVWKLEALLGLPESDDI